MISQRRAVTDGEQGRSPDDRGDCDQTNTRNQERCAKPERGGQQAAGQRFYGVACRGGRGGDAEGFPLTPGMYETPDREVGDRDSSTDEEPRQEAQGPQHGDGVDLGLRKRRDTGQQQGPDYDPPGSVPAGEFPAYHGADRRGQGSRRD